MIQRNCVQVQVDGKTFQMGGGENETHIKNVAAYVNETLEDIYSRDSYRCLPNTMKNTFIYLNLADDYITERERCMELEHNMKQSEKEISELKLELELLQIELEEKQ